VVLSELGRSSTWQGEWLPRPTVLERLGAEGPTIKHLRDLFVLRDRTPVATTNTSGAHCARGPLVARTSAGDAESCLDEVAISRFK
jgi:hypothetical protein